MLRDVVFISNEIMESGRFDLDSSSSITNAVFHILRNARVLDCRRGRTWWCAGAATRFAGEYDYTKNVGYELGLRSLDVCTGCGPGAMKGPMKGATIGHAKQRIIDGRYLGITEPGIIAAEPPNPIVSQLVDHAGHREAPRGLRAPGPRHRDLPRRRRHGRGDPVPARHPARPGQRELPFPVVFTGPADSADYFRADPRLHRRDARRRAAQSRYHVIIDDPAEVARAMVQGMAQVRDYRRQASDSYGFNWLLKIPLEFQRPFEVTHASMRALRLARDQPVHERAANLRRAFSGIVAGNIKEYGINAIERYGPFELCRRARDHGAARSRCCARSSRRAA